MKPKRGILGVPVLLFGVLCLALPGRAMAEPFAYITNAGSFDVSVIDTATNTVVATVTVGNTPLGVAVHPDGSRVYVANLDSTDVSVIDTATNTVVATVIVGDRPEGVSVHPDGSRVYVTKFFSEDVSVIDTATNTVVATVTGVGNGSVGVATHPDGSRVYVANHNSDSVSVIDTAINTVVATVAVGDGPQGVAIHPDGSRVYVANRLSGNNVSVIDTTTNTVVATITVGINPIGVATHPDGSRVYVANIGSNNVSVIDTATNTVVATITGGLNPIGVAVHPDGSRVYVVNRGSDNVSVIDTAMNTVVATVTVGGGPQSFGLFIGPEKFELTHFGSGGGLQSDVVIFNPSSTASASGEVNFFADDGTPLDSSVFLPDGNSFTLSPLGSATLSTTGAGDLFTGSATITSDIPISAVIRFDIAGVGVAGVPASQVLTSAIAPVRRIGTLSSGVAVRNIGSDPIQVTLELKDGSGNVVSNGTETRTLAGNAKIAEFIETLFPNAQTTTFTGTICVTAQSGQISVIALELDAANNVFTTLPVAPFPPSQATAQSFAYIANLDSDNVSVIDTATNTVVATVAVENGPLGVAAHPDGSRVYVANFISDNVSVIDTATNTVVATAAVGNSPEGVAAHPDGSRVYVANSGSNNVSLIETATNTVVATVAVGNTPLGVAVHPDGSCVYVANSDSANVSLIDTATNTVVATVAVFGNGSVGVAIQPDGSRLYVANSDSDNVSVIDTATNTVVAKATVGDVPFGVAVHPDGSRLYVANSGGDNISLIDTATNTVVATVPVGGGPVAFGQFIGPLPAPELTEKLELTHLGNGGGLQSDVVVFDTSSTAGASGEVNFFGDDGTPLDSSVFLPDGNSFTLAPLGSATLSTNGAGDLFTGSATITSDSPISAVIRFDITGVGVAGVQASQVLTSAIAPVRRTGTLSSGVAFRNSGSSTIQVTLELKDESGNVVSNGTETRTLAGNAKIAEFIETLFPNAVTTIFMGTICVTAQSGQISVIALELDVANNVFTTLPVSAVN